MPFQSKKTKLVPTEEERVMLHRISSARTEEYQRVERARMLLHYVDGLSISNIAETL